MMNNYEYYIKLYVDGTLPWQAVGRSDGASTHKCQLKIHCPVSVFPVHNVKGKHIAPLYT